MPKLSVVDFFFSWPRQVRAEVFHTLERPTEETRTPVAMSNESLLINELVREYLTYSGYHNTLSVFMAESGQPQDAALDRAFIRDEVKTENDGGVRAFQRERVFTIRFLFRCCRVAHIAVIP